jgi:prepilin-type N-terminal cleavage/methylation domain-containing protein/prepilin-type processing-associated H-X9-DG protein
MSGSDRHTKFGRSAFTLIELLVVVAIIAILATLLMPAMKDALDRSRDAACKYNLRQVGNAIYSYLRDHDHMMPPTALQLEPDPRGGKTLPDGVRYSEFKRYWLLSVWEKGGPYQGGPRDGNGIFAAYLGTENEGLEQVKHCPSMLRDTAGYGTYFGAVYYQTYFKYQTYAPNSYITAQGKLGPAFQYLQIPLDDVNATPTTTIAMVDSSGGYPYTFGPRDGSWYDFSSRNAAPRHFDRFNALFLDGHVEGCTLEEHFTEKYWTPPGLFD